MSLYLHSILWDLGVPQDAAMIYMRTMTMQEQWQMLVNRHRAPDTLTSNSMPSKNRSSETWSYYSKLIPPSIQPNTSPNLSLVSYSIVIGISICGIFHPPTLPNTMM
ncbi:hypothetical protein ACHAW6_001752 [Cyclotella cf. meneghiniana]